MCTILPHNDMSLADHVPSKSSTQPELDELAPRTMRYIPSSTDRSYLPISYRLIQSEATLLRLCSLDDRSEAPVSSRTTRILLGCIRISHPGTCVKAGRSSQDRMTACSDNSHPPSLTSGCASIVLELVLSHRSPRPGFPAASELLRPVHFGGDSRRGWWLRDHEPHFE